MAYVSDSNLTQFWGLAKDYINAEDSRYANWQKTEKAGAVTCWPVGGTELLPTVDFLFTETPPASGDKGPENPSKIDGVNLIHCSLIGEDLLDQSDVDYIFSSTGWTTHSESLSEDGWIKLYAKNESSSSSARFLGVKHKLKSGIIFDANKIYKIHLEIRSLSVATSSFSGLAIALNSYSNTDLEIYPTYWISNTSVITPAVIELSPSTAANFNTGDYAFTDRIQCNPGGEISIEYRVHLVEYVGTNTEKTYSAINLPSTYYGGTVDLATGVMTVTHVAVTPDASTVDISSAPAAIPLDYADTYGRTIASTDGTSLVVGSTGGTVVYRLAAPQTVQLTPTQILSLPQTDKYTPRLNTVYTDASSVQVGYVKSPIRSEYELTQAIIATEGGE